MQSAFPHQRAIFRIAPATDRGSPFVALADWRVLRLPPCAGRGDHDDRGVTIPAKLRCVLALAGAAVSALRLAALPAADAAECERVVIVANSADPDSAALAGYYAVARGIPADNIVALPLPTTETITWPEFVSSVFNPLFAELASRGWIDALPSELTDEFGRRKAMIGGHRISYLVLMRGVPLRIAENDAWKPVKLPAGMSPALAFNRASVDGELALLAASRPPVIAFVPNPLHRQHTANGVLAEAVMRVARLDGPTPRDARALVDSALAGERLGLAGRAYVDIGGPHQRGEQWLESVAAQLAAAGFDLDVDRAKTTFRPQARFDAPALYFGWYAWNVDGPFLAPGFRFPPGAIAVHLHSFSAQSLRSDRQFWCGPLVARGVAGTVGNVFEPYIDGTHHLDLLAEALLRGDTLGAAAYYALPVLSWQATLIGDPLYRPFARSQEEQYAERAALPAELRPHVVLRQARLALRDGRADEALRLARALFRETPAVPVGVSVAQLVREVEGPEAGVRALEFLGLLPTYAAIDLGAVRSAALLLVEWGAEGKALALYERALSTPPPIGEAALLEEAIQLALKTGQAARAAKWQDRLVALKPAPAKPPSKE